MADSWQHANEQLLQLAAALRADRISTASYRAQRRALLLGGGSRFEPTPGCPLKAGDLAPAAPADAAAPAGLAGSRAATSQARLIGLAVVAATLAAIAMLA
ncbi:MAG: hypothetical protein NVS9B10_12700 [Nevskia sp.]